MNRNEAEITLDTYSLFIEQVDSCIHGYLYIFDIKQDLYYISRNALERFRLENNLFTDTASVFHTLVHEDDIEWLLEDLQKVAIGEKDAHCLDYRWIDKEGNPVWINCTGRSIESGRSWYRNDFRCYTGKCGSF